MPGSILHRTKHTLGCNNDKGSQPQKKKKIPKRYKFLHKNIVVLFDWPRIYAPLTGQWRGVQPLELSAGF